MEKRGGMNRVAKRRLFLSPLFLPDGGFVFQRQFFRSGIMSDRDLFLIAWQAAGWPIGWRKKWGGA
jgi:hypothetical protein